MDGHSSSRSLSLEAAKNELSSSSMGENLTTSMNGNDAVLAVSCLPACGQQTTVQFREVFDVLGEDFEVFLEICLINVYV